MHPPQNPLYAGLGHGVRIGTDLVAALFVGGLLGWGIDAYLLPSKPWGFVICLILGFVAGVRNAYRLAQRLDHP